MKKISVFLLSILFISGITCRKKDKPKNIILCISDGCGFNHLIATDYYQYGKKDVQVYEKFLFSKAMSTYPDGGGYDTEKVWINFEYLKDKYTDSAAAATAMSTGVKTYSGAIGVDSDSTELINVVDIAEEQGKSTGVVSSVMLSHATPAGFVAHNISRSNYREIAREMLINSKVEVIMGCGHPGYDKNGEKIVSEEEMEYKYVGGKEIWGQLIKGGLGNDCDDDGEMEYWQLIQNEEDFHKIAQGETPERVLGIPRVAHTLQYDRTGKATAPFQVPFNKDVPNLADMTRAALNVLDNNDKGFFLMVEGGAVDWASHDNNSARLIEEQMDFNAAVEATVEWVENNSSWKETLIMVTADHECGYLWGPGSGGVRIDTEPVESVWKSVVNRGKGNIPELQWYSGSHTNSLVPIFANGSGWKSLEKAADEHDLRYGYYLDNAELGEIIADLLK